MTARKPPPQQIDDVPPPRPAQGTRAAVAAITRATHLACLVRDEGACSVGAYLDALTADQMYGLVVTLAAMVPDDRTVDELLDWTKDAGQLRLAPAEGVA